VLYYSYILSDNDNDNDNENANLILIYNLIEQIIKQTSNNFRHFLSGNQIISRYWMIS